MLDLRQIEPRPRLGRNQRRLSALVCLTLACLPAGGCQPQSEPPPATPKQSDPAAGGEASVDRAAVGEKTEPPASRSGVAVQVLDFDGIQRLVASHRGRVVVMDAWATSCPPCVQEFPKLVALSNQFGKDQLACISLSFDYQGIGKPEEKLPRIKAFLEKQKATFDNVLASEDSDTLYPKFHLLTVPAVFVYDKSGALRKRFDNEDFKGETDHFTYEDVERLVTQLVAEPGEGGAAGEN